MKTTTYIGNIFTGIWHLGQGLYITMLNFVRPKITEQYPENRASKVHFERFRALLTMPHDSDNHHKCTACGICMNNCPNGTIEVIVKTETDPTTGKPRRVLDRYLYDVGSCTFCALCTSSCPFGAIEFTNAFEHSVFTRDSLLKQLNKTGSSLAPKPAQPAPVAPVAATSPSNNIIAPETQTASETSTNPNLANSPATSTVSSEGIEGSVSAQKASTNTVKSKDNHKTE